MTRAIRFIVLCTLAGACSKSDPAPSQTPAAPPASAPTTATKPSKDPEAAKKLIGAGALVIDVRTPDEFTQGHLTQAINIPVQDFADRIDEVQKLLAGDKTKPIVVYCAHGSRAAKAKAQLEATGYTQVVNGGGFDDLQ